MQHLHFVYVSRPPDQAPQVPPLRPPRLGRVDVVEPVRDPDELGRVRRAGRVQVPFLVPLEHEGRADEAVRRVVLAREEDPGVEGRGGGGQWVGCAREG